MSAAQRSGPPPEVEVRRSTAAAPASTRFALKLRALAFYVGYVGATVTWATLSLLVAWAMPLATRHAFIVGCWTRMVLWWLRVTCGIRVRVQGAPFPPAPCILFLKHQSTWETLWVQTRQSPQATLIKRELLRIPFWGWAFALVRPIAIDRSAPRAALKAFVAQGADRLDRGMTVTLFPEGTRVEPGRVGRFQRGGAALAQATGKPVTVIAHTGGRHWPAKGFIKHPGEIQVVISEPIDTQGKSALEINERAEAWLRETMQRLDGYG